MKSELGKPDAVVILSPFPWYGDGVGQTPYCIARHLSNRLPVLYIEPPPLWNPSDSNFRMGRLFQRWRGECLSSAQSRLHILTPRSLPFGRWPFIQRRLLRMYDRDTKKVCESLGFRNPLLWVSYYEGCSRHLSVWGNRPYVYHCLDYFDHHEEMNLSRRAEVVFAVSEPLVRAQGSINPRTHHLPNGVDLDVLETTAHSSNGSLGYLKGKPRIGFVGSINKSIDFVLLRDIAQAFPEGNLILVGSIGRGSSGPCGIQQEALHTLRFLSNVHFLGFKPPRELGTYIAAFDVCLIPFADTRFNGERDPIKFYQYLAFGKPVVTTPIPVAELYRDLCYVAESPKEFIGHIREALDPADKLRAEARRRVAQSHTWDLLLARGCQVLSEGGIWLSS